MSRTDGTYYTGRPDRGRAYIGVKAHILSLDARPGSPLDAASLSKQFSLDPRDFQQILNVLSLEKLIDFRPGKGFFTKLMGAAELRALYRFNSSLADRCVRLAARDTPDLAVPRRSISAKRSEFANKEPLSSTGVSRRACAIFAAIAALSKDAALIDSVESNSERLRRMRVAEADYFDDAQAELDHLFMLMAAGRRPELKAALHLYHDRRLACVSDLCAVSAAAFGRDDDDIDHQQPSSRDPARPTAKPERGGPIST